jgi:EmrB/QacA subfamily drug resistance transporter
MDTPPLPPARIRLIFGGLALALLLAALDQTVVATALPTIATDLGGLQHIAWVVSAYLSGVAVAMPLSGKLGDTYGRKTVFLVAIVIFLVGSALCGLAQSLDQLIAFRALQGLGGGSLITLTVTMGADIVSPRELGRYQGYFGAAFGAASVLGPLAGGFFTEHLTWRWIFYINPPLGAICLATIAVALPATERRRRTNRLDYLGAAVLAAAIVCIVLVTSWGGTQYAWRSPTIIGLAAAAVAAVLLFIAVERRVADPVLPLEVFRNRDFSAATASSFFVGFGLFGAIAFLPLFLQLVQGLTPTNSGLLLVPLMLGLMVTGIASGVAITKTGKYKVYTVVGPLLAAAGMYLLHTTGPSTSRAAITVYMVAVGMGIGLCLQVLVLVAQNTASSESMGVVTSTVTTLRTIGGSVGVAVLGAVFSREVARDLTGLVPPGSGLDIPKTSGSTVSTEVIARLPAAIHTRYVDAFTDALTHAFFWTVPAFLAAALVAIAFRNVLMRQDMAAPTTDRTFSDGPR